MDVEPLIEKVPEYVYEARAERERAQAALAHAEMRKMDEETREAHARAEAMVIGLERERYKRKTELADDELHFVYRFTSPVGDGSVKNCIYTLQRWARIEPDCAITIIFTSPGGSVIDGLALFDFLMELRENGHVITTVARGYAASMAGILLQAGDVRVMGPEAWLLIHEISFGAGGSFGDVEDTVRWVEMMQGRVLEIFAKRSAASDPKTATQKLTKAAIKRRWSRKDWWLSSDDALKHGFIDEIR